MSHWNCHSSRKQSLDKDYCLWLIIFWCSSRLLSTFYVTDLWRRWIWWWWIMYSNVLDGGDMLIPYWPEKWKWFEIGIFNTYVRWDTKHGKSLGYRVDDLSGITLTTMVRVSLQHSDSSIVCVHGPAEQLVVWGSENTKPTIKPHCCLQLPQRVHIIVSPYWMDVGNMTLLQWSDIHIWRASVNNI